MRTQLITALVGLGGTSLGAILALAGNAITARTTARTKGLELEQLGQQARTQLYVDHVNQRREHRRATYLAFAQAVSALLRLTREEAHEEAKLRQRTEDYARELLMAAGAIESARDTVIIDGPQSVARLAAELCRFPYRVASAARVAHDHEIGSADWDSAVEALVAIRLELIRESTKFSMAGSNALNLDGVGNHVEPHSWAPTT